MGKEWCVRVKTYQVFALAFQKWTEINKERLRKIAETVICRRYTRYMARELRRKGPTMAARLKNEWRNSYNFTTLLVRDTVEQRAKEVFASYVRKRGQLLIFTHWSRFFMKHMLKIVN